MATTLLLGKNDLTKNTILGGNIDPDRYIQDIKHCQNIFIKPLLGEDLYTKMCTDFANSALSGDYLTLYNDILKDLVIHGTAAIYLTHGAYMVSNDGITKMKTDTSETVKREEIDFLVDSSKKIFQAYEKEFHKWIRLHPLTEYKSRGNWIVNVGGWVLHRKKRAPYRGYWSVYDIAYNDYYLANGCEWY